MMEQMEEQRIFYMWANRRGDANPDRAWLNRKRQRTGTETTLKTDFVIDQSQSTSMNRRSELRYLATQI
jgi:hypothetical protein